MPYIHTYVHRWSVKHGYIMRDNRIPQHSVVVFSKTHEQEALLFCIYLPSPMIRLPNFAYQCLIWYRSSGYGDDVTVVQCVHSYSVNVYPGWHVMQ